MMGVGGASVGGMNVSGAGSYPDWSTGSSPASLFGGGYGSPMGATGASMMDAGYGASGELVYVGRSMRPTPYDRPAYQPGRQRPTPIGTAMSPLGTYPSRGKRFSVAV